MKLSVKKSYLAIGLATGLLFCFFYFFGLFSGLDNFFSDLLFSPKPIDKDVVILAIDNDSINKIGQWPWPREIFAKALQAIKANPPKAVGMDIIFSEPSHAGANDDLELVKALGTVNFPVVLALEGSDLILKNNQLAEAVNLIEPLAGFQQPKNVTLGHANIITDKDGVARRFPLEILGRVGIDKQVYSTLADETVNQSGREIINPDNLLNINNIVYAAPPGGIRTIPFWRMFTADGPSLLKNKIVFIGATATDLHDTKLSPFGKEKEMPGTEIQAQIANMLLNGYRLVSLPIAWAYLWIILSALIPALLFICFKSLRLIISTICIIGFGYIIGIIFLFQAGILFSLLYTTIPWMVAVLGLFGFRYFIGEKEKRDLKVVFSKYVSPTVVGEILKNPSQIKLGGQEREITVFFSDIRGFTTISEKITPQELVRILNKYFTEMTDVVLKYGGVLDKYIGDAIMAFWGAPFDDPGQAEKAVQASLEMLEKLKKLNIELAADGDPEINIGIGLYTGPAVVGNIGSELRFNYTAMGDTVNVASRLEGLNKEYKTHLIIGESTKRRIKGKYNFKPLGSSVVKGRKEPIEIYTIEGV